MDGRCSRQPPSTTEFGSPSTAETTIPSTQRAEAGYEPRQLPIVAPPLVVPTGVDPTACLLAAQALTANALGQRPVSIPEAVPRPGHPYMQSHKIGLVAALFEYVDLLLELKLPLLL